MDSKKNQARSSSSSSSSSNSSSFDHLFGPRGSPSGSSSYSSSELLNSIFPPPSSAQGRKQDFTSQVGGGKFQDDIGGNNKGERRNRSDRSSIYQKAETAEPCYFSSSIYYGGQENYSPRSKPNDHPHVFKRDGGDDDTEDPNGNNSAGASRGNWWQGSLYY